MKATGMWVWTKLVSFMKYPMRRADWLNLLEWKDSEYYTGLDWAGLYGTVTAMVDTMPYQISVCEGIFAPVWG